MKRQVGALKNPTLKDELFRPCQRFYTDLDHSIQDCVMCCLLNIRRPWRPKRTKKR